MGILYDGRAARREEEGKKLCWVNAFFQVFLTEVQSLFSNLGLNNFYVLIPDANKREIVLVWAARIPPHGQIVPGKPLHWTVIGPPVCWLVVISILPPVRVCVRAYVRALNRVRVCSYVLCA